MSEQILTEQSNPASTDIDLLSGRQIVELINREDQKVAIAVAAETENIGRAVELIAAAFQKGGRLGYFGAGTSGRIGILDASECPPTFGTAPELVQAFIAGGSRAVRQAVENAEDNADFARQDIAAFSPTAADIVVGISASGNACYINAVLEQARRRGVQTIAVATNPRAAFRQYADIFICPEVGPEVIAGSSRLKSGTAQKMILNMLTTGAMIRCGNCMTAPAGLLAKLPASPLPKPKNTLKTAAITLNWPASWRPKMPALKKPKNFSTAKTAF